MSTSTITASVTIAGETVPRVELTPVAVDLLRSLWEEHGPLMFHQSGGCCDGSSPMLFMAGEFITSDQDVRLGQFDLAPVGEPGQPLDFWMSAEQFNYWSHTFLTVDVVPGRGSGFSAEAPRGVRFLIRSELMSTVAPFAGTTDTVEADAAASPTQAVSA
ncbi:DUF779 domain-containing protein [Cryobacterium sp. PH31-O1]|uniref:DUF779 domain-containing protein n=1 Tax=Cryobacterium sp. PH31-O1 TaxID=3046306 RepID=UPI0024B97A64|nr:DUF779 domain-containing protein [Cryobacterium sp. PH31-O1]MDJ0336946.1 DUF779 domain-containing protein [Cryobacterium sp. PH31-O1]